MAMAPSSIPGATAPVPIGMTHHNWLVTPEGTYEPFGDPNPPEPEEGSYRLYRFLTDLEDILATIPPTQEMERLQAITPLVRRLLVSSYWLQMEYTPPDPQTGWSVHFLYREYGFPLTLQTVTWLPGHPSPVHNHGTWGIVALISGQECNHLWRRQPQATYPDAIVPAQTLTLQPGDVLALPSEAIHQVEVLGEEPVISFNLYGETNFQRRYQFAPDDKTAQPF